MYHNITDTGLRGYSMLVYGLLWCLGLMAHAGREEKHLAWHPMSFITRAIPPKHHSKPMLSATNFHRCYDYSM